MFAYRKMLYLLAASALLLTTACGGDNGSDETPLAFPCASHSDCSGDTPFCGASSTCEALGNHCLSNDDCGGETPLCGASATCEGLGANGCLDDGDCSGETPWCSPESTCEAEPQGYQLGDGTPGSATLVEVYETERPMEITDLAFNPEKDAPELWVLRREFETNEPCDQNNATAAGCAALEGTVAIIWDIGTNDEVIETRKDGNAWHFMRRPTALAFGDDHNFATTSEARTANYNDDPNDYNGPSLWSSDLEVFAQDPGPGLNGSHLDMLHHAPYTMGLAHEEDLVFWVFNGRDGSIDRNDYVEDHGPGESYHGNALVHRFVQGQLQRAENIPSHMVIDHDSRRLFIADTGNERIAVLDMDSGTEGGLISGPNFDQLAIFNYMDGADLTDFVGPGTLEAPSGLALHEGVLFVTDNATSQIHAYNLEGDLLRSLDTELPAGSLAGLTVGDDDKIYFVDMPNGRVYRIDY